MGDIGGSRLRRHRALPLLVVPARVVEPVHSSWCEETLLTLTPPSSGSGTYARFPEIPRDSPRLVPARAVGPVEPRIVDDNDWACGRRRSGGAGGCEGRRVWVWQR